MPRQGFAVRPQAQSHRNVNSLQAHMQTTLRRLRLCLKEKHR